MNGRKRKILTLDSVLSGGIVAYTQRVKSTNPITYFTLGDISGNVAVDEMALGNGTYNSVTLGQLGIGDGKTSILASATSYINIYSAALNGAFNPAEFTISLWMKIDTAQWGDATNRWGINIAADATNNRALILKKSASNAVQCIYAAAGTTKEITYTTDGRTTFFHVCMTVSKSAGASGELKFFFNGAQVGVTQTGLGIWSGALSTIRCAIASALGSGASSSFIGNLAHTAIWSRPLTPAEVASISSPFDSNSSLRNLLTVGDSKTAGSGDTAGITPPGFQPILCRNLHDSTEVHYAELPVRIGIGGIGFLATAGGQNMKDRVDADIASMIDLPNEILINLGANDAVIVGDGSQWKTNALYVINAYHSAFPNASIRLAKIWKRSVASGIVVMNTKIDEMYSVNAWLKPGINEALFLEGGDDGATYTTDGTHPNHAGYILEANAWQTLLGY